MEDNSDFSAADVKPAGKSGVNQTIVIWAACSLALAILMCTKNNSAMVLGAGFFAKLFAVIVGTVIGLAGALLGDALRKFAHPSSVYTSGGFFQLIWIKLFWKVGPQIVGLVIGVALGCSLVLS